MTAYSLLILPGDGIGPEVMAEVKRLIGWLDKQGIAHFATEDGLVGGAVEQFSLLAAGSLQSGELGRSAVHGAAVRLHRGLRGDTGRGRQAAGSGRRPHRS